MPEQQKVSVLAFFSEVAISQIFPPDNFRCKFKLFSENYCGEMLIYSSGFL